MACTCLSTVHDLLAKDGHYIRIHMGSLLGGNDMPVFPLIRKDTDGQETRKGKARYLHPTFCPFCGTRYAEEPGQDAPGRQASAGGGTGAGPASQEGGARPPASDGAPRDRDPE